jgi:dTDP-4-amino-4,6-dideoxygalactose transaminase
LRTPNRDAFISALSERGIGCAVHYPIAVHQQVGWRDRVRLPQPLPVTERCVGEVASLPIFPELTGEEHAAVCAAIRSVQVKA